MDSNPHKVGVLTLDKATLIIRMGVHHKGALLSMRKL